MAKDKDYSIELLKAFAAIMVLNSHMDTMYGEYSFLATGGAIGDALFFFCSGYTLFMGGGGSFLNWYKRRIRRIYPTVLVMSLIGATYDMTNIHYSIVTDVGSGWFISCIFIYYVLLYPVRMYMSNRLGLALLMAISVIPVWYLSLGVEVNSAGNIYGATYFKWCFFFMFMLLGAICGTKSMVKNQNDSKINNSSLWNGVGLLGSLALFYVIYILTQTPEREAIQLLSLVPLTGICYFSWLFCNTSSMIKLANSRYVGSTILFVGGLCLEIYLVQGLVFTTSLNHWFPLNIPIIMIGVIIGAYVVRCLSRALLQTFEKEDYRWDEICKPILR